MMVRFTIPGEPIGKGRPKFRRVGQYTQTYTPKKTSDYEKLVKVSFITQNVGFIPIPSGESLRIEFKFMFEPPKSVSKKKRKEMLEGKIKPTKYPDIDNCIKACLDGMQGVVFENDNSVTSVEAKKQYAEYPRVEIVVTKEVEE